MRVIRSVVLLTLCIWPASAANPRFYGGRNVARSEGRVSRSRSVGGHTRSASTRCSFCERDGNGRIKRDPAMRREFQREHPCPANGETFGPCPGYVVDHIIPLKRGGPDVPSNMQWQTTEEAKAKDKIE